MKRKTIILGVLAILCIFWMGGYGLKLYGEYFDRKQEWNEAAKVSFEDALWMEVDKRSEIPIFRSLNGEKGVTTLKERIPDSVFITSKLGRRGYRIELFRFENSLLKENVGRYLLTTLLEIQPLSVDTLLMDLDSLLMEKQIPLQAQVRYVYTDEELRNDTIYTCGDGHSGLDSLTVSYMGFRCEHELTAFVSYPHWLSVLSTGEWFLWFLPWGVLGLLAAFYAPVEKFFRRKFVEVKIVEKEIHLADVPIDQAEIYQLPDGCLFNSLTATLTKGEIFQRIRPQSALLLKLFLQKENNCLSAYEIEHGLWNGQGTTDQLHKAIQRLRTDLKNASSEVLIKNVNGNYELKLPVALNELND